VAMSIVFCDDDGERGGKGGLPSFPRIRTLTWEEMAWLSGNGGTVSVD